MTIPLLLLISVAIFEFGRAYQTWQVLTNAAREGARVAVIAGTSDQDVTDAVRNYMNVGRLPLADSAPIVIERGAALGPNTGSQVTMIPEVANHLISSGGKRLRPMLTIAMAQLTDYAGDGHIKLAAAVEFMHTATLLHDDVVDESDMRRGRLAARKLWGNEASVLVGDFLLGQAFRMMVEVCSLRALEILSNAAVVIAEGEVMQLAAAKNTATTEDDYLAVIRGKTAELFAAARAAYPPSTPFLGERTCPSSWSSATRTIPPGRCARPWPWI